MAPIPGGDFVIVFSLSAEATLFEVLAFSRSLLSIRIWTYHPLNRFRLGFASVAAKQISRASDSQK